MQWWGHSLGCWMGDQKWILDCRTHHARVLTSQHEDALVVDGAAEHFPVNIGKDTQSYTQHNTGNQQKLKVLLSNQLSILQKCYFLELERERGRGREREYVGFILIY